MGSRCDHSRRVSVPAGDGGDALADDSDVRGYDARAIRGVHIARVPVRVQRVRAHAPSAVSAPLWPHARSLGLSRLSQLIENT